MVWNTAGEKYHLCPRRRFRHYHSVQPDIISERGYVLACCDYNHQGIGENGLRWLYPYPSVLGLAASATGSLTRLLGCAIVGQSRNIYIRNRMLLVLSSDLIPRPAIERVAMFKIWKLSRHFIGGVGFAHLPDIPSRSEHVIDNAL